MNRDKNNYTNTVTAHHNQSGSVLIVVLMITVGLTTLALKFGHSAVLDMRRFDSMGQRIQSIHAAEGVLRYLCHVLKKSDIGTMPKVDDGDYQAEEIELGDRRIWVIGQPDSDTAEDVEFGLTDEGAKLNLNTATTDMLMRLPGMTMEIAAAIKDWKDSDDTPSAGGAESETYISEKPSYLSKNSDYESPYELRFIHDVTDEMIFGKDLNQNGVIEEWENDDSDSFTRHSETDLGWIKYLTTFSKESGVTRSGEPKLNVKRATLTELSAFLSKYLDESVTSKVLQSVGSRKSNSVLEFFMRSQMSVTDFMKIHRKLKATDKDDGGVMGLVNINTAPVAVLKCLPGIETEETAQRMVDYRNASPDLIHTVAWVTQVLSEEQVMALAPYVTTSSYQFAVDLAVVSERGKGYYRTLAIVDTTGENPEIIYRRDLEELGWALGIEVRDELTNEREQ